ncbi:hypothetical protein MARINON1_52440 [Marinobacter salarius]|uniref:hypothetical protein n=1 Tax=Marinobacter salarius TaxID=1420917 RepID=UPI0012547A00|nr:hypothetical protein [Marinobacter salarius]VVT03109.1 hypothetical protein MBHK15_110308 [Marinobacter salarius]VXC23756.1 hypothetical protein MARINON1_52440 [Marinobacter salarius]
MEDLSSGRGTNLQFTEKGFTELLTEWFRFLVKESPKFVSVVISASTFFVVLDAIIGGTVSAWGWGAAAFVIGLSVVIYASIRAYLDYSPEVLREESEAARLIYRQQKCGWQAALSLQLLRDHINKLEYKVERILEGSQFIEPEVIDSPRYLDWANDRIARLNLLVDNLTKICTASIPRAISKVDTEEDLERLVDAIYNLVSVYRYLVDFEAEAKRCVPPSRAVYAHQKAENWTSSFRDGVRQFMGILKTISEVDKKELKKGTAKLPTLQITFGEPENVVEYGARIRQYAEL